MELYATVRRSVYVEGLSERAAARRFGLARETVRKMLRYRRPPGYRRAQPVRRPKLDAFTGVLSKNPIDAVRRADSPLDARRVATFVTAESRCSARPVCRLFPKCCRSSSWPSRAGSTRSRVTSLTLSRKRIASAEGRSVLAGSGSPTPSAGAGPHRPRASGDGYAVTGTPGSRPRPSSAGIDR